MKKVTIAILIIFCFTTAIFICGCSEQDNNTKGKTVTMTAKEHLDDIETIYATDEITKNFNSLDEGDTLIIQDTILNINYDDATDRTIIVFVSTEGDLSDSMKFEFEGKLTDSFYNDEQVRITVKIKHVVFSYQNISYDMELYEEQWVSEEYFNSYRYKPLPQSCITKI
jgi:hypothetical protein